MKIKAINRYCKRKKWRWKEVKREEEGGKERGRERKRGRKREEEGGRERKRERD